MRKLIVSTFVSLDGIMQAPGGPEEDPTGGFSLGGWMFGYWDEVMDLSAAGFDGDPHAEAPSCSRVRIRCSLRSTERSPQASRPAISSLE